MYVQSHTFRNSYYWIFCLPECSSPHCPTTWTQRAAGPLCAMCCSGCRFASLSALSVSAIIQARLMPSWTTPSRGTSWWNSSHRTSARPCYRDGVMSLTWLTWSIACVMWVGRTSKLVSVSVKHDESIFINEKQMLCLDTLNTDKFSKQPFPTYTC